MEGGPFRPPLTLERPKKPSINRVNQKFKNAVPFIFRTGATFVE